jgi:integrase
MTKKQLQKILSDKIVWQVVHYAEKNCCLRDRLIVYLLLTRGLRSGEICLLKAENIDFENEGMYVFDVKKKILVFLPLDLKGLMMLEELLNGRRTGYVFPHHRRQRVCRDKPLTRQAMWDLVHRIALRSGVRNFCPLMFRRHFAAFWLQRTRESLAGLQAYMRHANPQVTWGYANQFVFAEDVRKSGENVTTEMLRRGNEEKQRVKVNLTS